MPPNAARPDEHLVSDHREMHHHMTWHIRDFAPEDLEAAIRLDTVSSTTTKRPLFDASDVVTSLQARHPAVVAVGRGSVVGVAFSRVDAERAWVLRLALHPDWRGRGLGSGLLAALEHRLLNRGVRRITALLPDGETGTEAFVNSGFVRRGGITHFDKHETVSPHSAALLAQLGGSVPPAGQWQQIAGMVNEKNLIDRRIVLPLSRPAEAADHGVVPPHAIVLFGPPGTGKTTFARAIASRLGWPFVELFPSRLANNDGAYPQASARHSVNFMNWTMSLHSSTRSKRSPPAASPDRSPPPRSSTNSSSALFGSARGPAACWSAPPTRCATSTQLSCDTAASITYFPLGRPMIKRETLSGRTTLESKNSPSASHRWSPQPLATHQPTSRTSPEPSHKQHSNAQSIRDPAAIPPPMTTCAH